jgi:hypothetical protein
LAAFAFLRWPSNPAINKPPFAQVARTRKLAVEEKLKSFLSDTGMKIACSDEKSLFPAGTRWAEYVKKSAGNKFLCGRCAHTFEVRCPQCASMLTSRLHVLADFLIGAHALVHADCILSRDFGVYRTYFNDLRVVDAIRGEN